MENNYPNYEDTEEDYEGLCYMRGSQGVDGSKFDIQIKENYDKNLVCISRKWPTTSTQLI